MRFLRRAWTDLGRDPSLLGDVELAGTVPLTSHTAVGELAGDSVAALTLALAELWAQRSGERLDGPLVIDADRVAATFAGDRYFRLDGDPVPGFAPLSGFWATTDGFVRTHANYPHHEARLKSVLALGIDADRAAVAAALRDARAEDVEHRAVASGAVVTAVRKQTEWQRLPVADHLAKEPLVGVHPAEAGGSAPGWQHPSPAPGRPLSGLRVLDLTRVIAGPVATRALALAGADVLRIDPPQLPELAAQHLDTGQGKRSALLDLRRAAELATLRALLDTADVLVTGYRPDALAEFGLDDVTLTATRPNLVVGRVSAWGTGGPWRGRRGFDSIVQAAIGIGDLERASDGSPGALPVQALDHASGYLLAAGVVTRLTDRLRGAAGACVEVALARTGMALLETAGTDRAETVLPDVTEQEGTGPSGTVRCAPPAVVFPGAPERWDRVGGAWGADRAVWLGANPTVGG